MRRGGKKQASVDLLLITLYLAGGKIKGKTRLQKLAYLVWKKIREKLAEKAPKEIVNIAKLEPEAGDYGGIFLELQEEAPEYARRRNLINWLKPIGVGDTFELTEYGMQRARTLLEKARLTGIDIDGEIAEAARLPLNELIKYVYERSYPWHLRRSRIIGKLEEDAVVIWGKPTVELGTMIDEMTREGLVREDFKMMTIGECDELEPGLKLCVKTDKKGRPYFEMIVDNRIFER